MRMFSFIPSLPWFWPNYGGLGGDRSTDMRIKRGGVGEESSV